MRPEAGRDFLVFAYGSLMWRPDFSFHSVEPATLYGYHRAFCIQSTHYRGTPDNPGLVLGLDRGGQCVGRLYRVSPDQAQETAEYLHERELITSCYVPRWVTLCTKTGQKEKALAYVADRAHRQYMGKLSFKEIVAIISKASGEMGSNIDYLYNTVRHLDELGIADSALHRLSRMMKKLESNR